MTRISNEERIIEMLRDRPGLDDDELSVATGVAPRQQVNQICRLLESRGFLRRELGPRGKIVNFLQDPRAPDRFREPPGHAVTRDASQVRRASLPSGVEHYRTDPRGFECDPGTTLFIFPCSGSKERQQRVRLQGPSILDELPPVLARRLVDARAAVRAQAHVDEASLIPAWQRYTGSLYRAGGDAIDAAVRSGLRMVIVSGGYGLVLPTEPIGYYEAVFRMSWWPDGVLEDAIIELLRRHELRAVRAVASATTEYARFLRRVEWRAAGLEDAWLLTPEETTGAMVKSPRTQGEALSLIMRGELVH